MLIHEVQLRRKSSFSKNGLSERVIRKKFVREGFEVFRGIGFLGKHHILHYEDYISVRKKYDRLESLLESRFGNMLSALRVVIGSAKGMPDFFVVKGDKICFCEVKLEYETIKSHQIKKMEVIERLGLPVEIFRVKTSPYRLKTNILDNGEKSVVLRQRRFKRILL